MTPLDPTPAPAPATPGADASVVVKVNDQLRADVQKSLSKRKEQIPGWRENIDYRRAKPFQTASDKDRIAITIDWSATKGKTAQLFSQVPEVRLIAKQKQYKDSVPTFAKKLNETLTDSRVGVAMDECLPDCINAAGVGAVFVSYEARIETVNLPSVPPEVAAQMTQAGMEVPMAPTERPAAIRFGITRMSPADFLSPVAFTGSDFEDANWLGRSGRSPWSTAKHAFRLKDSDRAVVTGGSDQTTLDKLTDSSDKEPSESDMVNFEELFYWRYRYHPDELSFETIQHVVFVHGKTEPVIDEPWKGQKIAADGKTVLGSRRLPIRVLTLTYITDESIPPSDSAMCRPQVDELSRSRSQVIQQRDSSTPLRWADVNRIDTLVFDQIQRGTWQGIIPINGNGQNAIGEVARANYPREDFEFDRIAKAELYQTLGIGPEQGGAAGGPASRSAAESTIRQENFSTRIGYERARCVKFFVGIAEVVAGLLALYGKFSDEETAALAGWDRTTTANPYVYDVRADSSVLLDANQQIERLMKFLNMTGKSGYVNVEPIIRQICDLSGLTPADVMMTPNPPAPEPLNLSVRASGVEDLLNPLVMALLVKSGQAPKPEELEAAKKIIAESRLPPAPPAPPVMSGAAPPMPGAPTPTEDAHPKWNTMSRIEKRADDGPTAQ